MIGVFDSGLGGLSVLQAIAQALPNANLVYFADTAHVPYGEKTDDFIRGRVLKIGRYLVGRGCSLIVVACNTATAAAVEALRDALREIPVVGIEPGVKPAAASSMSGHIAVLATESTARSARLADLIRLHAAQTHVDILPCPGWATRVETLRFDDPSFAEAAQLHLSSTLKAGADRIVLGCTHYAFLTPILEPIVAGRATLINVAEAVARQCKKIAGSRANGERKLTLLSTANPERLLAAFPALSLDVLIARLSGPAQQATV